MRTLCVCGLSALCFEKKKEGKKENSCCKERMGRCLGEFGRYDDVIIRRGGCFCFVGGGGGRWVQEDKESVLVVVSEPMWKEVGR